MLTTVVGSYPAQPHKPASLTQKLTSSLGSYDPYRSALDQAVGDQITAGIDLISDGQVRGSMLEIFSNKIPGMTTEDHKPIIKGKITPAPYSIGASDLKKALSVAGKISPEFKRKTNLLNGETFQDNFKGIKGIITGPTSLALSSLIEGFYDKDKKEEIIIDLAWALKKEAESLQNAGAALLQIDEPYFSTGISNLKLARKAVDIITEKISLPIALHACGDLTDIWDELLKFKVDIVDCEFAGYPKNLENLEETNLRGKKVGLGCVDSKTDKIETKEQIALIIKKGIDAVGSENIIADPDCGMRLRAREAAFSKLKIMVETVKWLS